MRLIRDLRELPPALSGAALALGNFDGLHLGHQVILKETLRLAKEQNIPAGVMTFEPHPREFFNPAAAKLRLMRTREKLLRLKEMGFTLVAMPRFNAALAAMTPHEFISGLLVKKLGVKHVVTGEDFRFGAKRAGHADTLKNHGFGVSAMDHLSSDAGVISSSLIREALGKGDLQLAHRLLGHAYTISGRVIHGDKRGRQLGFPTANLSMKHLFLPRAGVYAGVVNDKHKAVVNIGLRPTVGGNKAMCEIHLLDFSGDCYGDYLTLEPTAFLRDEQKFPSLDALKAQIAKDAEKARSS